MFSIRTKPNSFSLAFRLGSSGLRLPRARWYTFKSVGPEVRRLSLLGMQPHYFTIQLGDALPRLDISLQQTEPGNGVRTFTYVGVGTSAPQNQVTDVDGHMTTYTFNSQYMLTLLSSKV